MKKLALSIGNAGSEPDVLRKDCAWYHVSIQHRAWLTLVYEVSVPAH
jgi:hypothetical protein